MSNDQAQGPTERHPEEVGTDVHVEKKKAAPAAPKEEEKPAPAKSAASKASDK